MTTLHICNRETTARTTLRRRVAVLAWAPVVATAWLASPPTAHADNLANGLTVNCPQPMPGDKDATCRVGGCPRVNGDRVIDTLNVRFDGGNQIELDRPNCLQIASIDVRVAPGATFQIQGCRKFTLASSDCTAWARYTFVAKPPPAPPGPSAPDTWMPKPPPGPPPGLKQAPPPPPPTAPTDAISVNFENISGGLRVNVNNSSSVKGTCKYDATAPNSLIPPFHKDFTVAANGGTHFDISGIPLGVQYNTVTVCHGDFDGKDVEIGRVELTKQF
jgi:hypothetical protein